MIFVNKTLDKYPGYIIPYADDIHLAETAIKIAVRDNLPEVKITERENGLITKEVFIKLNPIR